MATNNPAGSGANDTKKTTEELIESVSILKEAFVSIAATIKQGMLGNLNGVTDEMEAQRTLVRDIESYLKRMGKSSEKILDLQEQIAIGEGSSKDIAKQMLRTKVRQQTLETQLLAAHRQGLITDTELVRKRNEIKEKTQEELDIYKELYNIVKKREKVEERLKKTMDGYMKTVHGLQKIPFLGSLIDASHIQQKMNKYAEEYKEKTGKTAKQWKVVGVGIMATFTSIGAALINPFNILTAMITIITTIIKWVMEFEQTTFDIAKNIGVGVAQAERMRNTFRGITGAALTSKEVAESYAKITEQIGFLGPTSEAFAGTAAKLEKRLGMSADAMSGLALAGAQSNMQLNKAYRTAIGYAKVAGAKNKLALTERQIVGEISKVSSTVLMNFKGNLPALAEAVVRAKKLGTTLDQVAKQGDSLLDFESSISAEFEAQVLTGKNINLTRARELALAGDTAGLMEELNNQNMKYDDYMGMNVIQREAFAKSIGLSNEELSKQLLMQKQANLLGASEGQALSARYNQLIKEGKSREEIAGLIGSSAEAELNRASRAEQLEATFTRIKEQLASMLAGPIMKILDQVIKWLSNTENIAKIGNTLKGVFEFIGKHIKDIPGYLRTAVEVAKVLAAISIARAVANIAASAAMTPVIGAGLAITAGFLAYEKLNSLIPKFKNGGIVGGTSTTGDNVMAAVNSGEMILNKSQQGELFKIANGGGTGASQPINITVQSVLDGQIVATAVVQAMPKVRQRNMDGNTAIGGN